jgi:hypothetical protein
MSLFNFLKKQSQPKSPLEKFKEIKTYVREKTKSLMNNDFEGMKPEEVSNKILYQTIDQEQKKKLSYEEYVKLDKANEIKHVLDALREEAANGRISEVEIQEIFDSKEFKDYTAVK